MVRWYGESVAVRPVTDTNEPAGSDGSSGPVGSVGSGGSGGSAAAEPGTPAMFLWRDRVYVVREVLGHWRERRSWWSDPDSPLAECWHVWRIEAGAGGFGRGVYDLGVEVVDLDGSTDRHWRLLRALD